MRSAHFYGFMLGVSTSIIYYAIAAAYSLGAHLIEERLFGMNLERIMLVIGCIVFGAQSIGKQNN